MDRSFGHFRLIEVSCYKRCKICLKRHYFTALVRKDAQSFLRLGREISANKLETVVECYFSSIRKTQSPRSFSHTSSLAHHIGDNMAGLLKDRMETTP